MSKPQKKLVPLSLEDRIKNLELKLTKLEVWARGAWKIIIALLEKTDNRELLPLAAKTMLDLSIDAEE